MGEAIKKLPYTFKVSGWVFTITSRSWMYGYTRLVSGEKNGRFLSCVYSAYDSIDYILKNVIPILKERIKEINNE